MAKRRNENGQMRREDYEAAEDDERYGGVTADSFSTGFERASEASIKQRKIVKARVGGRPPVKPATAAPAPVAAKAPEAGANPFGGFRGLTASQPAAPSTNPFTGFSGLTSAGASASPATSIAAAATTTPSATNGASKAASAGAKTYQEAIEALNKEFLAFVNNQARENPSVSWVAAVQEYLAYANAIGDKHASTRPVPLEQQNKKAVPAPFSFAPMAGAPLSSSVTTPKSPANGSFGSSTPSSAAKPKETPAPAFSAASTSSFSFGSTEKDSTTTTTATPSLSFGSSKTNSTTPTTTAPSFSFGSAKKDAEPSKETPSKEKDSESAKPASRFGGFSFGGNSSSTSEEKKTIPAFSFGAAPVFPPATSSSTASPITSGFSFGGSSSSAASPSTASTSLPPASKPFSFGASAASSSTAGASGANEDEDEENIGREEATVILKSGTPEEDDCTFEVEKAKVLEFKKDEKRWADKGVHPLQVLVNKETKSGRVLIRNEIGKIVLNAALYKGIKLKPHEAKGKKTGVLLSLQADADTGLTQFILKVNTAKVDDLIASLDKAANGASS